MYEILSICRLNLAILLKDKVAFGWTAALPTVLLMINRQNISSASEIIYFLIYIYFNAFAGIGVYVLREKDYGTLSTIFSIKWIPVQYFLGTVLTQILFSILCAMLFNIALVVLTNVSLLSAVYAGLVALVVCLPTAFLSYNLTLIKGIHSSTMTSILNVSFFGFFILLSSNANLNQFNPFYLLGTWAERLMHFEFPWEAAVFTIVVVILSIPSILFSQPLSVERR